MDAVIKEISQQGEMVIVEPLVRFIATIRPPKFRDVATAEANLKSAINYFSQNTFEATLFSNYVLKFTQQKDKTSLLTDVGILSNSGFRRELLQRINYFFLPEAKDEHGLRFYLEDIFYKDTDYIWVQGITTDLWVELFEAINFKSLANDELISSIEQAIINALKVLSYRIAAIGLDPEIIRNSPELERFESPFLAQNYELIPYLDNLFATPVAEQLHLDEKQILVLLHQCEELITLVRNRSHITGASVDLTYSLLRLNQCINRLKLLLNFISVTSIENDYKEIVEFMKILVKADNLKKDVRRLFNKNVDILALQITEHASHTGEHYVAHTRKEYVDMFKSALGGGAVVSVLAHLKMLIYHFHFAPFFQAFWASMNYSFGFIFVHVNHWSIATKQPAMTASKLAATMPEEIVKDSDLDQTVTLIAKIIRTQFIAIFGNILITFPFTYLIAWCYKLIFHRHIADPEKAYHLIKDVDPFTTPALLYAAIAGFCLFVGGLVSGYYDNKVLYNKIPQRILQSRRINKRLGKNRTIRFANYIDHNMGSLAGNFFLGIFLGSIAPLGIIFGLAIDVRHVTLSTGGFAIGLVGLDNYITIKELLVSVTGILLIAVINLLVSFMLALSVAIKSRKLKFKYTRLLLSKVKNYFLANPTAFFFPGKDAKGEMME